MNLEQLASMLKKDAAELASTLNLQKTDDVPFDVVQKEVESSLKLAAISSLSEGKKQAEGKAKREVLSEVEKTLKSKFDVDGSNLDEIVEALTGKVGKVEYKADDKVIKERDIYKAKWEAANAKLEAKLKEFEKMEIKGKVKSKLEPILEKFDFVTGRVKDVAVDTLLNTGEFVISDNNIFLMQDDKPIASFEQFAEKHFSEFGKAKQVNTKLPTVNGSQQVSFGTTQRELFEQLRKATTAEEKAAIQEQLKKFD